MDMSTLETGRLRPIGPASRHFDELTALRADACFVEHLEIDPHSRHDAHHSSCAMPDHWQLRGWGG